MMMIYNWIPINEEAPQPPTKVSVHNPRPGFIALSFEGSNPALVGYETGLSTVVTGLFDQVYNVLLDDLTLDLLNQAVEALGVDTSAQTAAGLRRAIERHLEEAA